ncbi:MAG TPA: hypothetical protein VNC18_04945 [Gemmatimonadaceae bacterium]|jgi:hypothetical protein|nr:hypothetical protein [Gemmatimonadaceae bacterium]
MTALYLLAFVAGLMLAVRIMIRGVERPADTHPLRERSFRHSPAVLSAFGLVFGLAGYMLAGRVGGIATFLSSAALGLLASFVAARLVTKWWAVIPEHDVDDERYVLQGHIARVTKSIRPEVDGEVAFEVEGKRHVLRARGIDQGSLDVETEVVIERIEDDIAFVEAWAEVEKRL